MVPPLAYTMNHMLKNRMHALPYVDTLVTDNSSTFFL